MWFSRRLLQSHCTVVYCLVINRVLLVSLSHVVAHGCPVQSHVAMEEFGNLFSTLSQQILLLKKLDALLRLRRKAGE